jgi:hypothetical protein
VLNFSSIPLLCFLSFGLTAQAHRLLKSEIM